jgi:hypothetical protein
VTVAALRAILDGPCPDHHRLADLNELIAHGENLTGAARRLRLSVETLTKWLERQGRYDLVTVLRARDPLTAAELIPQKEFHR